MKTKFISIVSTFSNTAEVQAECREGWDELTLRTTVSLDKYPWVQELTLNLPTISNRDNWRFVISSANGDTLIDINSNTGNIEDEIDTVLLETHIGEEVTVTYTVTKRKVSNVLSVYNEDLFLEFMEGQSLMSFLAGVNNRHTGELVLEMVGKPDYTSFCSLSICIVGERHVSHLPLLDNRDGRITIRKSYCQWNRNDLALIPEDIYTTSTDSNLAILFRKVACLLSAMYVCDSSIISNALEMRLCGYRTMNSVINVQLLRDLENVDLLCDRWFAIYDWCYTGGYSSDRISIARNVISLNIPVGDIIKVNETTLQAIKSNFKIFEQDNVRQYIKVRNEVSNLLLELQTKVNGIVEGFTGEFKKNIIAIFSFFLTVVVVRVIAKGDFLGGFSNPVIFLSFIFIGISAVLLIYSRSELSTKERLFDKHYKQLRDRYAPLLSEEELTTIFDDSDPKKCDTHANYIQWQKKVYTGLWIGSLIVLSLFLIYMLVSNCITSIGSCKITKAIISCCIRNILN